MLPLHKVHQGTTLQSEKGLKIMQNLRSFFFTLSAVALVAVLAFLTFSVTLAFAGVLAAVMIARAVSMKLKPAPVRARTGRQPNRVWNDGRGTIIDL